VLLRAYAGLADPPPLVLIGYEALDTPKEFPAGVIVRKNWPHGAVMQAWRRSLLGLVPSICLETFGLVVLEAMAAGRAVIASRIGGLPEVVEDGETGFLVTPGDVDELHDRLAALLNDPGRADRMGRAAREVALQRFTWRACAARCLAAYEEMLGT
jgi:glycosyltransferase involved in cell wall biosynthesis